MGRVLWALLTSPSLDDEAQHQGEDGAMTLFMVITAFLLLLLTGLILHQGAAIVRKIDLQNQADAVAMTVGGSHAEALNRLVTQQHLAGEELAWAVIPEALAGPHVSADDLEPPARRQAEALRAEIVALAKALQLRGEPTPAEPVLVQEITSGATTGEGKVRLRAALVRHYQQRLAGTASVADEIAILKEWNALTQFEGEARSCLDAKEHLLTRSIPALLADTQQLVAQSGIAAAAPPPPRPPRETRSGACGRARRYCPCCRKPSISRAMIQSRR